MTQQNNCTEILDLIPEYAFGLADEVTTRRVEAALPTCPEAVQQLDEYRRLQAELRADVPQIAPPSTLARHLRAAISADSAPNLSTVVRQTPRRAPEAGQPELTTAQPRRLRRALLFPLLAAAALIALVVTNVYWFSRVNNLSGQIQDATAILAQLQNNTFSVRNAESLELVQLSNENNNSFAMIMWDKDSTTGLIYTRDFPELQTGKVYQLWLANDEGRISGGTFTVTPDGEGALIFTAPVTIGDYDRAGVTEEPEGGSPGPTSPAVVSGTLQES